MKMNFLVATMAALCAGVLVGCHTQTIQQGSVMASYSGITLTADLPDPSRVPMVMAAAEETLRGRGYAIKRSDTTEEAGSLVAVPPRANDFPRMLVEVKRKATGTRITMSYRPLGDEEVCRSALDGILVKLGL